MSKDKQDFVIIGDGNCPRCGKPIPTPQPNEGDAVMCDCAVWFVSPKRTIICKGCPNLIQNGRQLRCKVCNIKTKLDHEKYACIFRTIENIKQEETTHDQICEPL